jgi:hypothetical protein
MGYVMDHGDHDVSIFTGHDYVMAGDIHKTFQVVQEMSIEEKEIDEEELPLYIEQGWIKK